MSQAAAHGLFDSVNSLFGTGTCSGLTDGQLLERFTSGKPGAREVAFESLVLRHGPMVMRLCQSGLRDPQDVHDAFQAVFLVLARRSASIRRRDSVASWLYGVALRVIARVKASAARRRVRDERTTTAAEIIALDRESRVTSPAVEFNELAEVVHQELGRLPERYRTPILLCCEQGLTQDQAAARLNWPVGTVRSRLARGRDRLRLSLTRRGITHPTAVGPILASTNGAWPVSTAPAAIPRALAITTARTVVSEITRHSTTAALIQNASTTIAEGVIQMMMFRQVLHVSCALIPLALATLGGGLFMARAAQDRTVRDARTSGAVATLTPQPAADLVRPDRIDQLAQKLLEAAKTRYETQKAYYEEGRITLDRLVDASKQLELAELRVAKNAPLRQEIRRRSLKRFEEIESREKDEFAAGRTTVSDMAEATQRRLEGELELLINEREQSEIAALVDRIKALERKVEALEKGAK
jgi:RNA polymerase sigma factor (sigma-70 family)